MKVCEECGKETEHLVKGMCKHCYQREFMKKYRKEKKKNTPKREIRNEKTLAIIGEYMTTEISQSELARKYNLTRQRVSQIIKRSAEKSQKNIDKQS